MVIFSVKEENKQLENYIVIATSFLVFVLGLINTISLWKKRNQVPFSNISPGYLIITFICKNIK